jgi:hypothetical protein
VPVEMYRSIPRSYVWVLPNSGHIAVLGALGGSAPTGELFPQVALSFLRGDWEVEN